MIRAGTVLGVDSCLAQAIVEARGDLSKLRLWAGSPRPTGATQNGGPGGELGVVFVTGLMLQHSSLFGTATEAVRTAVQELAADKYTKRILLVFHSPGGDVAGVTEAGAAIARANRIKPVTGWVNSRAGSAAYWLASQAGVLVVTPSGEVGSIGVYGMHVDQSEADRQSGLRFTYIEAPPGKAAANEHAPLSGEAQAEMQRAVDRVYGTFVADVSRGRFIAERTVRENWRSRVFGAREAVDLGLADAVGGVELALQLTAEDRPRLAAAASARAAARIRALGCARAQSAALAREQALADLSLAEARITRARLG